MDQAARIMVVDDEPDLEHLVRQKFRSRIRAKDFEFVFAHNGVEALERLRNEGEIDIVMTDINMPEMDGLTLLGELQKIDSVFKTIVVSAYGDMENIRSAMNCGAFDFVTKPIDLNDLEATLDKSLNELRVMREGRESHDHIVALQQELSLATQIQASVLPQGFPVFPDRTDFDIYAEMTTASEVGGDLYDFFLLGRNQLGFTIGDVSGKGVPAALFMTVSRTLLKAVARDAAPPDSCLSTINKMLMEDNTSTMFITLLYGVLDTSNGRLCYSSGGHNPPYLVSAAGEVSQMENVGGLFVGAMAEAEYESISVDLEPGDTIFLYTDGITGTENPREEIFDFARLEESLGRTSGLSVTEMVKSVVRDVQEFRGEAPLADDTTCLAVRYLGS